MELRLRLIGLVGPIVMLPEFEIMGLVKLKLQILDVMSTKQTQELLHHEFNSVYQSILTTD